MIHDFDQLVAEVLAQNTNPHSDLHGPQHWQAVAHAGLYLADATAGADREVVLLFGLFHDAMRLHDNHDPDHGRRAAVLVTQLAGRHFSLAPAAHGKLTLPCAGHADGFVSADPTIGVCWDADRLNLWRVGVEPDPRWLSTEAGRAAIGWSRTIHLGHYIWPDLFARSR